MNWNIHAQVAVSHKLAYITQPTNLRCLEKLNTEELLRLQLEHASNMRFQIWDSITSQPAWLEIFNSCA